MIAVASSLGASKGDKWPTPDKMINSVPRMRLASSRRSVVDDGSSGADRLFSKAEFHFLAVARTVGVCTENSDPGVVVMESA
jgi:hypothetical protein